MPDKNTIEESKIQWVSEKVQSVRDQLNLKITGLVTPVDSLLASLLVRGHVLMEGMPGLAKTLLAKSLAEVLDVPFSRIQFTPDLLPADLTGTTIFNPKTSSFDIRKGPVFTGILLADEVNRAPAKVQSALLQCMEERQVSLGDKTFDLDENFVVIATQNPIDQEGTYQLPEAQMDRFLIKVRVAYPSQEEELGILNQHGIRDSHNLHVVLSNKERSKITDIIETVFIDEKLKQYIVQLVRETRPDTAVSPETKNFIKHGASPRASLAFLKLSKARALLQGRSYVLPEDIKDFAKEILRHRILLRYEAIAEEIDTDTMIDSILESVRVP